MPIGAIVDGKTFCVHGGLSPEIKTIDQVRTIDRKIEIPHEGPFCDLMWSDPEDIEDWAINARGAGWVFGSKVTNDFCHINGIELIARAHQLVQEGYIHWFKVKIFSIFRIKILLQYGVHQIIVTDVIIWLLLCKLKNQERNNSKFSKLFQNQ